MGELLPWRFEQETFLRRLPSGHPNKLAASFSSHWGQRTYAVIQQCEEGVGGAPSLKIRTGNISTSVTLWVA